MAEMRTVAPSIGQSGGLPGSSSPWPIEARHPPPQRAPGTGLRGTCRLAHVGGQFRLKQKAKKKRQQGQQRQTGQQGGGAGHASSAHVRCTSAVLSNLILFLYIRQIAAQAAPGRKLPHEENHEMSRKAMMSYSYSEGAGKPGFLVCCGVPAEKTGRIVPAV
jgi:hypothetical protein